MTAPAEPARSRWPRVAGVTLLFTVLTAIMTWPQSQQLATSAPQHQDVYFNLWRLLWIAHSLRSAPAQLFTGNIFYPEPRTLTLSDAILFEGLVGAPLVWAGLPPMLVHNLLLLGAIVASAVGMYALVRTLTGRGTAGIAAGIIFAFVPYRFDHYMHMELQWTVWIPWSFWALHRTLATRSWRSGLLLGLFIALQMLSSIYYGIILCTLLPFFALLLLISMPARQLWPSIKAMVPGAMLAVVICGAYAVPYMATKSGVGGRSVAELVDFSARPSNYLISTPDNVIWGSAFASRGRPEKRLFPGLLCALLALTGLLLRPPSTFALACLLTMVLAFDMSLGLSGYSYPLLYAHVPIYEGLRALARVGIFVVFFLAILAADGLVAIIDRLPGRAALGTGLVACLVLLAEYRVRPLALVTYAQTPPPVYAWLAQQPRGVVAELPMRPDNLPGSEPQYAYYSTFHWMPLVNGYSGFTPASHLARVDQVAAFPDPRSLQRLRRDGVRYLVVHLVEFEPDAREPLVERLVDEFGLAKLAELEDGRGEAVVFGLR